MRDPWRKIGVVLLLAMALPTTWVRTESPDPDWRNILVARPIAHNLAIGPGLNVESAWELSSPNWHFGSYSALVEIHKGRFLAATDGGNYIRFSAPDSADGAPPEFGWIAGKNSNYKSLSDAESLARDPVTGRIWVGYEDSNAIVRREADLSAPKLVHPAAMRGWSANSGAESLVRLRDGRFVVISEGAAGWGADSYPAILFDGDPVEGAKAMEFRFHPPTGYRPVDMAQLPDGRVLILLRDVEWGFPPRFRTALAIADPSQIAAGAQWNATLLAKVPPGRLQENYEGLAIVPDDRGGLTLWLISDDNSSTFQHSKLLKLRWLTPSKDQ